MTILVTGGAGYIGTHTCVELLNSGYDIVVVDNFANSRPKALERVREITGKSFPFYEMDLRDSTALDKVCQAHKPDAVIHFAGLKAVAESVAMPLTYYGTNLTSTMVLLGAMEKHGIKHIIFSSTAALYSAANTMPLTEESARGCTNPYGWTKYMCEQIISDTVAANPGWSAVLLRYFNAIGAHESGLIGESPLAAPNNVMPLVAQAAAGKRELQITGADYDTPDGTGVRDYIHVTDLVAGHIAAIKYGQATPGTHVFNLGTGKGTSVLEIVNTFEEVNGIKIPYQIVGRRPGDIGVCYADPSKAERLLGWKAVKTVREMCADIWRWQTNNPNGYE